MSIHTYSSDAAGNSYVIFATHHPGKLFKSLIQVKTLDGCCKGRKEVSYICNTKDWQHLADAGILDGQESVLVLGPWQGNCEGARPATMHFRSPCILPTNLGYFREAPQDVALLQDGWTKDGDTYYICEHNPGSPRFMRRILPLDEKACVEAYRKPEEGEEWDWADNG